MLENVCVCWYKVTENIFFKHQKIEYLSIPRSESKNISVQNFYNISLFFCYTIYNLKKSEQIFYQRMTYENDTCYAKSD